MSDIARQFAISMFFTTTPELFKIFRITYVSL